MFVQLHSLGFLVLATISPLLCLLLLQLPSMATSFELSHQYVQNGGNTNADVWNTYNAGDVDDDVVVDDDDNEPNTRNSSDDLIYLATKSIDAITMSSHGEIDCPTQGPAPVPSPTSAPAATPVQPQPIDLSDFIALIPANQVKDIVANYYHNDREVQRAYTYLRGKDFAHLKLRILAIPEIHEFLRYLNASGVDVVGFMYDLANLTGNPDMESGQKFDTMVVGDNTSNSTTPSTTESMNGLHGLVDSILDILPQDQILTLFFDKFETSEEFSTFVENIGSPEFSQILQDMENSLELKNLVYTLHNNGIYVTRIVDSLKAYFFLGTF